MSKVVPKPRGKTTRKGTGKKAPKGTGKPAGTRRLPGTFLKPSETPRKGRAQARPPGVGIPPHAIQIELDGPGASPEHVDAVAFLRLTDTYIRLLTSAAKARGAEIVLTGFTIHDKCIAAATVPNNPQLAAFYAGIAADLIDGKTTPEHGLENLTREAQVALRALPHTQKARVKAAGVYRALSPPEEAVVELPWERVVTRARVLRIGGMTVARASFVARPQGAFTLDVAEDDLPKLGAYVWKDVELEAIVNYDATGRIAGGRLLSFTPVVYGVDESEVWRAWFLKNADEWLDIEDIEAELRPDDNGADGDGEGTHDGR